MDKDSVWKFVDKLPQNDLVPLLILVLGLGALFIANISTQYAPTDETGRLIANIVGIILFALGLGWLILNRKKPNNGLPKSKELAEIEKIKFDYKDSPQKHGWKLEVDESSPTSRQPSFISERDGFVGNFIRIDTEVRYYLDYDIKPTAQVGNQLEFIAKYSHKDSCVYCRLFVQSRNNSISKPVWLKFLIGGDNSEPIPYLDGQEEWEVFVKPNELDGEWLQFTINLRDAVAQTFGQQGWKFQRLEKLRVRGPIAISKISILKPKS